MYRRSRSKIGPLSIVVGSNGNQHYIGSTMPPNPLPAPAPVLAATQSPIAPSAIAPTPIPPDATEEQLISLWLHGKSPNTVRAYRCAPAGCWPDSRGYPEPWPADFPLPAIRSGEIACHSDTFLDVRDTRPHRD